MPQQAVTAIRAMIPPGTTLQVIASQHEQVPVGRKQIVVEILAHGVMTEIVEGGLPENGDPRSFIPIGCTVGPTDAEQLEIGSFAVWHMLFPDKSRITYKVVDTIYQAITKGADGRWTVGSEGADFTLLADELFDVVTAPGAAGSILDWHILPKQHILAHPDQYPMVDTAPSE